jgi:hypothetical protein
MLALFGHLFSVADVDGSLDLGALVDTLGLLCDAASALSVEELC